MGLGTFFVFALFLFAGVGMVAASYRIRSKSEQARTWPTTTGRILSLDFDDSMDPDGSATTYQVNVKYAYSVRGAEHLSSRIAFGYSARPSRQSQFDLFTSLQKKTDLVVHYNPAQPGESVLDTSVASTAPGLLMAGIIWVGLTIGLFALQVLSTTKATSP